MEPGDGWAYARWLGELAAHPEMNGAQLGKVIADSFVESCANFSVNLEWLQYEKVATFSVVDVAKAHRVYEAYAALCSAVLQDTALEPWPLAALGRAAGSSIRYASSSYNAVNTIDLGTFMENLSSDYPQQTAIVLNALESAVLYHRETSYTLGSKGLSIYFPTDVDSLTGLLYFLEYINDVCLDPDVQALYYYKVAGCLNEQLQAYASQQGYGTFDTLDTTPLKALALVEPSILEDYTVELPISNDVASLMMDVTMEIARYDADSETAIFYGADARLELDEYRTLRTKFDGTWATLDGHLLTLELIDESDTCIRYRSPIQYNGTQNAYLLLARDLETDTFSILGVQVMEEIADTFGRNLVQVEIGSRIAPCYRTENLADETIGETYGDSFSFGADSVVRNAALPDGEYFLILAVSDTRGDEYYPTPVLFTMKNGAIAEMSLTGNIPWP